MGLMRASSLLARPLMSGKCCKSLACQHDRVCPMHMMRQLVVGRTSSAQVSEMRLQSAAHAHADELDRCDRCSHDYRSMTIRDKRAIAGTQTPPRLVNSAGGTMPLTEGTIGAVAL